MRKIILFVLIPISVGLTSCSSDDTIEQENFGSYRYFLWRTMLNNDHQIDFIGTEIDPYRYPNYLGHRFDNQHQGTGGIRSDEVFINLDQVLNLVDSPNIALIGIGINDVLQGFSSIHIAENLRGIIDKLQNNNPNITIIVEQIAGLGPELNNTQMQATIEEYNVLVKQICIYSTNTSSVVIPIDINSDFSDDYFSDDLHYNLKGSNYVALKYYSEIERHANASIPVKILPIGDSRVVGYRN